MFEFKGGHKIRASGTKENSSNSTQEIDVRCLSIQYEAVQKAKMKNLNKKSLDHDLIGINKAT